jgi:hypothetical protein
MPVIGSRAVRRARGGGRAHGECLSTVLAAYTPCMRNQFWEPLLICAADVGGGMTWAGPSGRNDVGGAFGQLAVHMAAGECHPSVPYFSSKLVGNQFRWPLMRCATRDA